MHPYPNDFVQGYFEREWTLALRGALEHVASAQAAAALADTDDERDDALCTMQAASDAAHKLRQRLKAARDGWCMDGGGAKQLDVVVREVLDARGDAPMTSSDLARIRSDRAHHSAAITTTVDVECVGCGRVDAPAQETPVAWAVVDPCGLGVCSFCHTTEGIWKLLAGRIRLRNLTSRKA